MNDTKHPELQSAAFWIKPSMKMANNRGDRTPPWRSPALNLMNFETYRTPIMQVMEILKQVSGLLIIWYGSLMLSSMSQFIFLQKWLFDRFLWQI